MSYLIGIDIGTSGTKTVLFDEKGKVIVEALREYPMYQPHNGWAEQLPSDWWNAAKSTLIEVVKNSNVPANDIKGIGLSGQMHGLVMLDQNNQVIRPSIIWCDQRTGSECDEITNRVGEKRLIEITANPALTGFTASKILWVRNNEPENYEKCKKILLPKDYIRFMLTGEFATEVSDASGMQLLDIAKRDWSKEILEKLEIDSEWLAKVYESPEVSGQITSRIAEDTGLTPNTIVVGGAGDNAAAAVGTGVVVDGQAFTTIGTSGVVYAHTSKMQIDPLGRVHTFCCAVPGAWHLMGVTQGAGLSLKWFRDNFCQNEIEVAAQMGKNPYQLMDQAAALAPIGANRLLFLPYLMGERTPHLNPDARGVFFGLSAMHQKRDMIRAILEGVSYSMRDCFEILQSMGSPIETMRACGGGAGPMWRQMLADVYQCDVTTLVSKEGPALGVALLAGVGAGLYKNVPEACKIAVETKAVAHPDLVSHQVYNKFYKLYQDVYPSLKEHYKTLSMI